MNLPFAAIAQLLAVCSATPDPRCSDPETVPPTPKPKVEHSTRTLVTFGTRATTPPVITPPGKLQRAHRRVRDRNVIRRPTQNRSRECERSVAVGLKRSPPLLARIIPEPRRPDDRAADRELRSAQVIRCCRRRDPRRFLPFCTEHACAGVWVRPHLDPVPRTARYLRRKANAVRLHADVVAAVVPQHQAGLAGRSPYRGSCTCWSST